MVCVRFALSDAAVGRYALAQGRLPSRIYLADLSDITLSASTHDMLARLAVLDATSDWPTYNLALDSTHSAAATYFVVDDVPSTAEGWESLLAAYIEAREQELESPANQGSSTSPVVRLRYLLSQDNRTLYEQALMGISFVRKLIGVASEASVEALLYQLVRQRFVVVAQQHDIQHRQEALKAQAVAEDALIDEARAQVRAEEIARRMRNSVEEARWIARYGSPRLQKLLTEGYMYAPLYVMERAHVELPHYLADVRHWVDYSELEPDGYYDDDTYIPSEAALAEAARVHGRIVKMYGLGVNSGMGAALDYHGIAVMVEDYLGICNLFLPWPEWNPSVHP